MNNTQIEERKKYLILQKLFLDIQKLIQETEERLNLKREAMPLRQVIKKVLMHLYCKGVIPKSVTQNVYDILKLKDS